MISALAVWDWDTWADGREPLQKLPLHFSFVVQNSCFLCCLWLGYDESGLFVFTGLDIFPERETWVGITFWGKMPSTLFIKILCIFTMDITFTIFKIFLGLFGGNNPTYFRFDFVGCFYTYLSRVFHINVLGPICFWGIFWGNIGPHLLLVDIFGGDICWHFWAQFCRVEFLVEAAATSEKMERLAANMRHSMRRITIILTIINIVIFIINNMWHFGEKTHSMKWLSNQLENLTLDKPPWRNEERRVGVVVVG